MENQVGIDFQRDNHFTELKRCGTVAEQTSDS